MNIRINLCRALLRISRVEPGQILPWWCLAVMWLLFPIHVLCYMASRVYDVRRDMFIIEGVCITRDVFALWSKGPFPSCWFRVIKNEFGTVTLEYSWKKDPYEQ